MTGCRTKRARRIAESARLGEFVGKLRRYEDQRNHSWLERHDSCENPSIWLCTPISHGNRSADARDDSNYEIAQGMLEAASCFSQEHKWPDSTSSISGETFIGATYRSGGTNERSDAWPGGLILGLLIRADDAGAIMELKRIVEALSDYPVLSDEDVSEREWDQAHPSENDCWRTDDTGLDEYGDECSCPEGQRRLLVVEHKAHPRRYHETIIPDQQGDRWCDACDDYVGWLRA